MSETIALPRRRRWPLILVAPIVVLGGLWAGFWYYGVGIAERAIADWKSREAQSGRVYSCVRQSIGGFPFGIEVHCAGAGAELIASQPPLAVKAKDLLISARVWRPTLLTGEVAGPLTIAEPGMAATVSANWQHAQVQVRGLAVSPENVSIKIDGPIVDRAPGGENLFKAARVDVNGRILSGTVHDRPVIEIVLKLAAASAPGWHQAAAAPADADITVVLRGLKDFSPKPWPERFMELQAAGGRIEIVKARIQQGDTIAVASGALGLSATGRLDGQLNLTVANLEKFLPLLGLDRLLAPETASPQISSAFSALDRIMPGLGNIARKNAGPAIVASVNILGQPAELEGKRAVSMPLRFSNGAVTLGPLPVGFVPALF
jgi:hypothetical protein